MKVIIAEKPSLGRNIADAIGSMQKKSGYYEGDEYIVTWAFGHLFTLCDIEDYSGGKTGSKWTLEGLPCFPSDFAFKIKSGEDKKPDRGVEKQFGIIKWLCLRDDVDTVINAGDADREGEVIVRLCMKNALGGSSRKLLRLWLPDQTPETINAALFEMKDETEYDNLANEGFARTYMDWLYGVNLTRFATLKTGALLRVGRVIVPVVKAVYDRDIAIRNFVPDIYYALVSKAVTNGEPVELTSKYRFGKDEKDRAQRACNKLNAQTATVTAKKKKKEILKPGKLYSLTKLQNHLGKKYKMTMDDSLRIVQGLYEKGFLTYPRTNSEYLATAEKDKVKKIIAGVKELGYPVEFKDSKNIFDDSKIESHSALTPTFKLPSPDMLSDEEKKVYSAVLRRFVAVFCSEDCVTEKTELTISVGECEDYTIKGTVITEPGWTKYDDASTGTSILPKLEKGDIVNIDFHPVEKQTTAPKHYTIETLNNYLKNPFREEKAAAKKEQQDKSAAPDENEDDTEEYRAVFEGLELGTEATRTGIIGNAIKSKYIELKKGVYYILPDGEYLITQLSAMGISMDKYKTSEMGKALKKVFHGKMTVPFSLEIAKSEIAEVFSSSRNSKDSADFTGFNGDVVGVCPLCGKNIIRGKYYFACENYKNGCTLHIDVIKSGRPLTVPEVTALLRDGKTARLDGFISKNGKAFSAALKLEDGKSVFDFQ